MTKKVFVVGGWGGLGGLTATMFMEQDWEPVKTIAEADLVQFTGGEDINPALYGAAPHPRTYFSERRDKMEIMAFEMAKQMNKPMAGICRGGQLLNVMCGGKMFQDVDKHMLGEGHEVLNLIDGTVWQVTSLHHQMMIPTPEAMLVDESYMSTRKSETYFGADGKAVTITHMITELAADKYKGDPETVIYFEQNCLCFQGHPEFGGLPKITERYFSYINDYILPNKKTREV